MNIFDENRKIHQKNIEEYENRQIEYWSKKVEESSKIVTDLALLMMVINGCSTRVTKTILKTIEEKWKNKN